MSTNTQGSNTESMNTAGMIEILKKHLQGRESELNVSDIGYVSQIGDGIATIYGLDKCMSGEMVEFSNGVLGMVFNLERENTGVVVLGYDTGIKEGDSVKRTYRVLEVPVGAALVGRVVNSLGVPLDGKGAINTKKFRPIEVVAPGVIERQSVRQPLQTGVKSVDATIPIGKGQRELIIGDRQTGKTAIAVDAILNQKNENVICIYVAIAQRQSALAKIINKLEKNDALKYTIIVSANASDPAAMHYIAPYAGCAMAEEFLWQGKDVLIIYDDLSKHAIAYRQISLLLRRPPGREAYPGDVFYLHSRLLERACKLSDKNGGGSITALPIIETQAGDISAYIPTNVISITDGQIYLEPSLFFAGIRPAVNVGLSVSRVGGSAQIKSMRQVAGKLRLDLAQYRELGTFAKFGAELDKSLKQQLIRGEKLEELLKQTDGYPVSVEKEILVLYAGVNGYLDDILTADVKDFEKKLCKDYDERASSLTQVLKTGSIDEATESKLKNLITEFKKGFLNAQSKVNKKTY
jgi:F-type H+-transporting ATPase subunit alpha